MVMDQKREPFILFRPYIYAAGQVRYYRRRGEPGEAIGTIFATVGITLLVLFFGSAAIAGLIAATVAEPLAVLITFAVFAAIFGAGWLLWRVGAPDREQYR